MNPVPDERWLKRVTYEMIFQQAREAAAQRAQSGEQMLPDDTVCVIASASGQMYTGFNRRETINGLPRNIHAEIEAMRAMKTAGENTIRTLLLISCANGMPLLPCDDCMRSILTLNPDNIRCEIMMMDRAVPIAEFFNRIMPTQHTHADGRVSQPVSRQISQQFNSAPTVTSVSAVSVQIPEATNDANLLRNKVTDLLNTVDDDDDTDEEQPKKKKGFGGLFRKK